MNEEQIVRVQLVSVLDNVKSIMHELTIGELDELIDEVTRLYEHYNSITDMRNGEKPE
jgi:hypothetical protein